MAADSSLVITEAAGSMGHGFEVHDARSRPAAPRYVDSTWRTILRLVPGRWSRGRVSSSHRAARARVLYGDAGGSSVTCSSCP
jgi:hypothetical protein